jgi:hypothetical protein
VYTPHELIEKLIPLIPRPRCHLVRYHGILGPAAKDRAKVVSGEGKWRLKCLSTEMFSRDPGFWRFVPPEVPLHRRIFDLIHRYLSNNLARESHLLQLVFYARYVYEPAMPIYLLPGSYERIREAL